MSTPNQDPEVSVTSDECEFSYYDRQGPLWNLVEAAIGTEEPQKDGWCRAACNWLRLLNVITHHPKRALFDAALSKAQATSWRLLVEWWEAQYQDAGLSQAAQAAIKTYASSLAHNEMKPRTNESLYHSWMFLLFDFEFFPTAVDFDNPLGTRDGPYGVDEHLQLLGAIRQECVKKATSQRIGYASYQAAATIPSRAYHPLGSIINPCQWLSTSNNASSQPFYLWDIHGMHTVETDSLQSKVPYTCISHTWGRWKIEPPIHIPGVPWAVPQNSRFDVRTLPRIFAEQQWQTGYIWFDLFCIPQDRSQRALQEIARQASIFQNSKARMIWFSDVNSWTTLSKAIEWLGLMYLRHTSTGIYETTEALGALFEDANRPIDLMDEPEKSLVLEQFVYPTTNKLVPKFLLKLFAKRLLVYQEECSPWFSSLWTLQESCLCPDFGLFDKEWRALRDSSGTLLTLDNLFTLYDQVACRWEGPEVLATDFGNPRAYEREQSLRKATAEKSVPRSQWPLGPKQIGDLMNKTKADQLLDLSRSAVLVMGNLRQCTESRAEAVMSVIGATDWYTNYLNRTGHAPPEDELVLGIYPLAFVKEAARRIGGAFYYVSRSIPETVSFLLEPFTRQAVGSMLPFSGSLSDRISIKAMNSARDINEDHPAVASWNIQANASILIQKAGVLASTETSMSHPISASVILNRGQSVSFENVDLGRWLNQQSKDCYWFAVVLFRSSTALSGIILRGKRFLYSNRIHLFKTGLFLTPERTFPPSRAVNWLVL
jgi:hypothetical protein